MVDRKASKNRKIRYHVLPKIVNFMNPIPNDNLYEGRDELIAGILKMHSKNIPEENK